MALAVCAGRLAALSHSGLAVPGQRMMAQQAYSRFSGILDTLAFDLQQSSQVASRVLNARVHARAATANLVAQARWAEDERRRRMAMGMLGSHIRACEALLL